MPGTASGTTAGEPCQQEGTTLDVVRPVRRDYRRLPEGWYARRNCFFCAGTGRNMFDREDCACLLSPVEWHALAAQELHERADTAAGSASRFRRSNATLAAQARYVSDRLRPLAIGHARQALLTALRERGLTAEPHTTKSRVATSVAITTRFGRVLVDLRHSDRNCVVVRRPDGTRWLLRTPTEAREVAHLVHNAVPELTAQHDQMVYVVACAYPRRPISFYRVDCPSREGTHCSVFRQDRSGVETPCPGPRAHLWQLVEQLRASDRGPDSATVWGAFPASSDTDVDLGPIREAQRLVQRGDLIIR